VVDLREEQYENACDLMRVNSDSVPNEIDESDLLGACAISVSRQTEVAAFLEPRSAISLTAEGSETDSFPRFDNCAISLRQFSFLSFNFRLQLWVVLSQDRVFPEGRRDSDRATLTRRRSVCECSSVVDCAALPLGRRGKADDCCFQIRRWTPRKSLSQLWLRTTK
jgi:hypothetical protein